MNDVYKLHGRLLKTTGAVENSPAALRRVLLSCAASAPESLTHARALFSRVRSPDTFAYNTIIRAHAHFSPSQALVFFLQMLRSSVPPDNFTFPFVLKAGARLQAAVDGVHALTEKLGLGSDLYVQNALVSAYGSSRSVESAGKLFDEMPQRDLVSWSSMISCKANNGFPYEALTLFQQMQMTERTRPDEVTMLSVILAVSTIVELELGRWVETYMHRTGLALTVPLGTALVDMYSRCGSVEESMRVFDAMPERNVLTWTTLINGLAVHGLGKEALRAFDEMKSSGVRPDPITFNAVLVACSHSGLVDEGWKVFESIGTEHRMEITLEHYGCMVDMMGRAGLLQQACNFVEKMPIRPNSVIWRILLGACANHSDVKLAEQVKERIREIDPHHDGDYVLLSNVYGGLGRWTEKSRVRNSMQELRISKRVGYSLISVDREIHSFLAPHVYCRHHMCSFARGSGVDGTALYTSNSATVAHADLDAKYPT
ncbi:hypothetical protein CDL15_Pgr009922 [Punica granatum]|uniref:Pentatricopeptide repeat-containing protein n=1 Tax=Punica granatum TaxID=22663 RepID=A0A218WUL9_PUNGR|nr:hypothetical protein CDL15_Pgr009922 [Punica granatum]